MGSVGGGVRIGSTRGGDGRKRGGGGRPKEARGQRQRGSQPPLPRTSTDTDLAPTCACSCHPAHDAPPGTTHPPLSSTLTPPPPPPPHRDWLIRSVWWRSLISSCVTQNAPREEKASRVSTCRVVDAPPCPTHTIPRAVHPTPHTPHTPTPAPTPPPSPSPPTRAGGYTTYADMYTYGQGGDPGHFVVGLEVRGWVVCGVGCVGCAVRPMCGVLLWDVDHRMVTPTPMPTPLPQGPNPTPTPGP